MTTPVLVFGWRSALLGMATLQLLVIAASLTRSLANRSANAALAALLAVLAGMLTPFAIGFAGFYDRWPWLTFAPFAVPLAIGPLVWLYAQGLVTGGLPRRWKLHLAPAAVQFAYLGASFLLPLAIKQRWDALSTPWIAPALAIGVLAGLAAYGFASWRLLHRYRAFLAASRSDDHRYAARWLSRALIGVAALLAVRLGYYVANLIHPLNYFDVEGLYFAIAALGVFLGMEGWRHADRYFPSLASPADAEIDAPPAQDWRALGHRWAAITREEAFYADPELSLASLARKLGTNPTYLSRALNAGVGVNFSTFVNGLRAERVAAAIAVGDPRNLLELALDAGFSSKASFNRAFVAAIGATPSEFRRRRGSDPTNLAL